MDKMIVYLDEGMPFADIRLQQVGSLFEKFYFPLNRRKLPDDVLGQVQVDQQIGKESGNV